MKQPRGAGTRALAFAAATVAVCAVAGVAWGATGDLTAGGCIEDNDAGPDDCTMSLAADGLEQSREIVFSPDGTAVYVVSFGDSAVVPLERDPSTGVLSYVNGCISDSTSPEACGNMLGMNGASSVAMSADGNSLYVGSELDDAIVHYDRTPGDSNLDQQTCVEDDTSPDMNCAQQMQSLNDVRSVVVSPDGGSVYAAALTESGIQIFDRNVSSGALTDGDCVVDATVGTASCFDAVEGLQSVRAVAISPDSTSLYAMSEGDDAVLHFSRNTANGDLTFEECFSDDGGGGEPTCTQIPGLSNAYAGAVSPDGKSLYVASNSDRAITRFDRSANGDLTPQGCVDDVAFSACAQSMQGLDAPVRVVVSPDNRSVYATGNQSDSIAALDRDPATGAVTPSGCVGDDDTGPPACTVSGPGLEGIWGIAVSPDGGSLYTASRIDNAVSRFTREQFVAPAAAPPPAAAPTPVPGQSVIVRPVSGQVTIRLPGTSAFVPITTVTSIPVGSEIDTRKGVVNLSSIATGGPLQSADFKFGLFRVTQSARQGAFTELKLVGPLGCGRSRGRSSTSSGPMAEAARGQGRSLWGSGKGKFRTSGRKGSGAARGTIWWVSDFCNGKTRIKSIKSQVVARDFVRKVSVILRTGQAYFAPGPKRD